MVIRACRMALAHFGQILLLLAQLMVDNKAANQLPNLWQIVAKCFNDVQRSISVWLRSAAMDFNSLGLLILRVGLGVTMALHHGLPKLLDFTNKMHTFP